MADELDQTVTETAQDGQKKEPSVSELMAQIEQIKKTQAGSDKAYQETAKQKAALEAELEALKKEKMTEKEKSEYEIARQRKELEDKQREVADATLRFSKMKIFGEKKIPLEFDEFINGSNENEIKEKADTFLKHFNEAVRKGVDEKLAGTKQPARGDVAKPEMDLSTLEIKDMEKAIQEKMYG